MPLTCLSPPSPDSPPPPPPCSTFNDLKLVIDNRTYSNIDGRWRDLFNKMKVGQPPAAWVAPPSAAGVALRGVKGL